MGVMPAPKFKDAKGKTVTRIKASVFLHPELHEKLTEAAKVAAQTLSEYVSTLMSLHIGWKPETATPKATRKSKPAVRNSTKKSASRKRP